MESQKPSVLVTPFRSKRISPYAAGLVLIFSMVSTAAAKPAPLQRCVNKGGSGGCSTTIQGAVGTVPAGATAVITIAADASPYAEDVVVDNISASFVGAGPGKTIVDGTNALGAPTFLFRNNSNGELHGLTIQNGSGPEGSNVQFSQENSKHKAIGTLKIEGCEITGGKPPPNFAGAGAVDVESATLIVDSSSIDNNRDEGLGFDGGKAYVTNSTISGNDTTGTTGVHIGCGLRFAFATSAALDNDTITDNKCLAMGNGGQKATGGGIFVDPSVKTFSMANTIVAGNSATVGPDCFAITKYKSKGFNLIENTSGCTIVAAKTDLPSGTNPELASLTTCAAGLETQTPEVGSPLLGKGDPKALTGQAGTNKVNCLPVDECGTARAAKNCVIGAIQ